MALRLLDASATTPVMTTPSSCGKIAHRLDDSAPLPPAPPRNPRVLLVSSKAHTQKCTQCASLTMTKNSLSATSVTKCPTLQLTIQHRSYSAPAMLAFGNAWNRMKQKGHCVLAVGAKQESSGHSSSTKLAALNKLNDMFPTSPEALSRAKDRHWNRRHQRQCDPRETSQTNASFLTAKKSSSTPCLDHLLLSISKSSSNPRLTAFARTPSGGRLTSVSSNMRRVRSGNGLFWGNRKPSFTVFSKITSTQSSNKRHAPRSKQLQDQALLQHERLHWLDEITSFTIFLFLKFSPFYYLRVDVTVAKYRQTGYSLTLCQHYFDDSVKRTLLPMANILLWWRAAFPLSNRSNIERKKNRIFPDSISNEVFTSKAT